MILLFSKKTVWWIPRFGSPERTPRGTRGGKRWTRNDKQGLVPPQWDLLCSAHDFNHWVKKRDRQALCGRLR